MNVKKEKKKVFVGMSGGVDSSVTAALLKKQGYDVTGVFIKVWQPDFIECTWKEDRRDAMRVAALLDIPFFTLNLENEYKKEVVDYMIRVYKAGWTPNPDVMCNKEIKFGVFLKWARKKGADYVATGHYARVEREILNSKSQILNKFKIQNSNHEIKLLEGKDKNKDQSYFLWTLTQDQLDRILFPIGGMKKDEVRKLAKKFKLPNFDKKDSQGLCFIGKVEMKEFLQNFIKSKKGKVLDEKGNIIGEHEGAYFFTIGQRHGFDIIKKGTSRKPYFVIKKDVKKNILIVSNKNQIQQRSLGVKECKLREVNWVGGRKVLNDSALSGRIRYRGEKQKLVLVQSGQSITVKFQKSQEGLASGQSLVLYKGEECIGGGIFDV